MIPLRAASRPAAHRLRLAGVCAAVTLAAGFLTLPRLEHPLPWPPPAVVEASHRVDDLLLQAVPSPAPNPAVVFVALDEKSISVDAIEPEEFEASRPLQLMAAGYPWSREVYAFALDRLVSAGARAVIFDLLFTQPREGDEALAAALVRHPDRFILAANFDSAAGDNSSTILALPSRTLLENPAEDPRVGFVNFLPDADGVVRSALYRTSLGLMNGWPLVEGDRLQPSLSAAALAVTGKEALVPPGLEPQRLHFTKPGGVPEFSFYEMFVPRLWKANLKDGEVFRDKYVVIGPSATRFQDYHRYPLGGTIAGPLLHANALSAALDGAFLRPGGTWTAAALVILGAVVAWAVACLVPRPLLGLGFLLAAGAILFATAALLVRSTGLLLPVAPALFNLVACGIFALGYDFTVERRERARARRMLDRYVSRDVVRDLLDNPGSLFEELGGVRKSVAILFSDVRDFTTITEHQDPSALITQLNEYLREMVNLVFGRQGSVDKFIGDAVMAVWGGVHSQGAAGDAAGAVACALEMRECLGRLNRRWQEAGLHPWRIGIGINHGEVIFGNIGSEQKMEPTVIGDAVNLASRVEGLNKTFHTDILVTGEAAELVRDRFDFFSVDRVTVKGRAKPVVVYGVFGPAGSAPNRASIWEGAVAAYFAGDLAEAAGLAGSLGEGEPPVPSTLVEAFLERCRRSAEAAG